MEVWSGKPTDYENLRVFHTMAFVHVKKDKLEKGLRGVSLLDT